MVILWVRLQWKVPGVAIGYALFLCAEVFPQPSTTLEKMMANWFYFDANGNKIGPIDGAALKRLASVGAITPETMVETEKSSTAGKIQGLVFGAGAIPVPLNEFSFEPPIPVESNSTNPSEHGNRLVAAALALTFGVLGLDLFYCNRRRIGLYMLIASLSAFMLLITVNVYAPEIIVVITLNNHLPRIILLITFSLSYSSAIRYLLMTDKQFDDTYFGRREKRGLEKFDADKWFLIAVFVAVLVGFSIYLVEDYRKFQIESNKGKMEMLYR